MEAESRGAGSVALLGLGLLGVGPVTERLERAAEDLGRPAIRYEETERAALRRREAGNYVPTVLPRRYDVFVHLERTSALHPLGGFGVAEEGEVPETFPTGM